ncbi:BgTH12-07771 [Blumeria graminis f. sp. triticale]|uniref:BgTH12-07771 n=1 Tax=Blumeria graminis f. sp. triticale TaxID=1689686 RepID=A0A9W4GIC1_BLUGR|nr:BgTH12-07771 [Blumeria graminis f. sp. triticale]
MDGRPCLLPRWLGFCNSLTRDTALYVSKTTMSNGRAYTPHVAHFIHLPSITFSGLGFLGPSYFYVFLCNEY